MKPINTEVQTIIRTARANGASFKNIAEELNARGVTTERGKQWTTTAVHKLAVKQMGLPNTYSKHFKLYKPSYSSSLILKTRAILDSSANERSKEIMLVQLLQEFVNDTGAIGDARKTEDGAKGSEDSSANSYSRRDDGADAKDLF